MCGREKEKQREARREEEKFSSRSHQAVKGVESSRVERMPSEMMIEVKSAAAAAS